MSTVTEMVAREITAERIAAAEQAALTAAVRSASRECRASRRLARFRHRSDIARSRIAGLNL
jgi:hypothetical protein